MVVNIGPDGSVQQVTIANSSGYVELDQATIDCIKGSWHFKPATLNGKPVASVKKYMVSWRVNQDNGQSSSQPGSAAHQ